MQGGTAAELHPLQVYDLYASSALLLSCTGCRCMTCVQRGTAAELQPLQAAVQLASQCMLQCQQLGGGAVVCTACSFVRVWVRQHLLVLVLMHPFTTGCCWVVQCSDMSRVLW